MKAMPFSFLHVIFQSVNLIALSFQFQMDDVALPPAVHAEAPLNLTRPKGSAVDLASEAVARLVQHGDLSVSSRSSTCTSALHLFDCRPPESLADVSQFCSCKCRGDVLMWIFFP